MLYKQIYLSIQLERHIEMILCGMSELIITPHLDSDIPGYYHARKGMNILDDLYAKAVVFDDGNNIVALVAVDLICVTVEQTALIRSRAHHFTGIDMDRIAVSATHTITGGPNVEWSERIHADQSYVDYFVSRAADAVTSAYNKRILCSLGFGYGRETQISFNRRYLLTDGTVKTNPGAHRDRIVKPDGPIDPEIGIVRVDDVKGNPIGIITNFACHMDTVGGCAFSADYSGELSRQLKTRFGENIVSLFLLGACGDVNHVNFMVENNIRAEHHKWMGQVLAEDIGEIWKGINISSRHVITAAYSRVLLNRRFPGAEEARDAERRLAEVVYDEKDLSAGDVRQVDRFYSQVISEIAHDEKWKDRVSVEIQVFKIGDAVVFSLPGEYFAEFGIRLKSRSPYEFNIINTQANGNAGYIPTKRALRMGGFEGRLCHWSNLEEDAEAAIEHAAVNLVGLL